ncbi:MAG: hypothetical protein HC773_12940 [Scytonema sp. CRU_2_7]|nr:hypothetical protein [Scytonema sp. CRU_2_7]
MLISTPYLSNHLLSVQLPHSVIVAKRVVIAFQGMGYNDCRSHQRKVRSPLVAEILVRYLTLLPKLTHITFGTPNRKAEKKMTQSRPHARAPIVTP